MPSDPQTVGKGGRGPTPHDTVLANAALDVDCGMLCFVQQLAAIAHGAVVAERFAELDWPQIAAGALGIGFGVFLARKQLQRWTKLK